MTFFAVLLVLVVVGPILWQVPRTFAPVRLNASGTEFTGLYRRYSVETFTGYVSDLRTWSDKLTIGSVTGHTSGYVVGGTFSGTTTISDNRRDFHRHHQAFFLRDQSGITRPVDAVNVGAAVGEGQLVSVAWLLHNRKTGNAFMIYNHTTNLVYIEETRRGMHTARKGLVKMVWKLPLAHQVLLWLLIVTWPLMLALVLTANSHTRGFRKRGSRPLVARMQYSAAPMSGHPVSADGQTILASPALQSQTNLASQVQDLSALYQAGSLTFDEFQAAKAKLLA
jgi:hypothetical protein